MTRDEAILELSVLWERHKYYEGKEAIRYFLDGNYIDALDMAIEALKAEPCEDAADRNYILQRQKEYCDANCPYSKKQREFMCSSCMMGDAIEMVEDAPPVTPARKKGKWIAGQAISDGFTCSECNTHYHMYPMFYRFCPICGADMRGVSEWQ